MEGSIILNGLLSSPAGTGERFLGTIAYSPREHLLGKPPTAKIDIYAATQVLFLMLVGRTPFAALRTERALGQALLSPTPPIAPLLTTFGDFPELLVSIAASGLSHNPDERLPADAIGRVDGNHEGVLRRRPGHNVVAVRSKFAGEHMRDGLSSAVSYGPREIVSRQAASDASGR